MVKVPAVYWGSNDDWTCEGGEVWWELQDAWCFHVKMEPWPPRAGPVTLTFRYGPDDVHMRYAIRTEPPFIEEVKQDVKPGWMPLLPPVYYVDHTPWEWCRFPPDGFRSDAPPFWAVIELPPGKVWLAFDVQQQDHMGEWFGPAALDWELEVGE